VHLVICYFIRNPTTYKIKNLLYPINQVKHNNLFIIFSNKKVPHVQCITRSYMLAKVYQQFMVCNQSKLMLYAGQGVTVYGLQSYNHLLPLLCLCLSQYYATTGYNLYLLCNTFCTIRFFPFRIASSIEC
jgi:hypothetical protein